MNRFSYILLAVISLLSADVAAEAEHTDPNTSQPVSKWVGPIEMQNQFPLALNHISLSPMSPDTIPEGALFLRGTYSVSNTYILARGSYSIDGEYRVANIAGRYGVSDRLDVGLDIPIIWRGGGYLDHFVDDFHQAFGMPRGDRPGRENDKFGNIGVNDDNTAFAITEEGTQIGDATVAARYSLRQSESNLSDLTLVTSIRLPTRTEASYGQDSVDLAGALVGATVHGRARYYWGAGYIYYGDVTLDGLTYDRHHGEGFLGVEYLLNDRWALQVAFIGASPLTKQVKEFPGYSFYIDTGVTYRLTQNETLQLLLRENPAHQDSTADFTVMVGFTQLKW